MYFDSIINAILFSLKFWAPFHKGSRLIASFVNTRFANRIGIHPYFQ